MKFSGGTFSPYPRQNTYRFGKEALFDVCQCQARLKLGL